MMVKVLSVGGSIVAPDGVDAQFVRRFAEMARKFLARDADNKLILVVGGGGPARRYQTAFREIAPQLDSADEADWIGIMATRLNAQLLRAVFSDVCKQPVVTNPTECESFDGRILVAAGWKPGFSTDNDAVLLAEKFGAKVVVNLSNVEKVYTDDPRKNPDAKPIDSISWRDFRKIVGDEWIPGKNTPFDPIASARAEKAGVEVICAGGKNIENIEKILNGEPFVGTKIGG